MAIFLADIALEEDIINADSWLGIAISSFQHMSLLADWAVVREGATDTLAGTVVEGIYPLIPGYDVVVEPFLIHFDWSDIGPNVEGELLLVGGVDLGEDIDRLIVSSEGYFLKVVGDAELGNSGLVGD